jgi:hypothetical protein
MNRLDLFRSAPWPRSSALASAVNVSMNSGQIWPARAVVHRDAVNYVLVTLYRLDRVVDGPKGPTIRGRAAAPAKQHQPAPRAPYCEWRAAA